MHGTTTTNIQPVFNQYSTSIPAVSNQYPTSIRVVPCSAFVTSKQGGLSSVRVREIHYPASNPTNTQRIYKQYLANTQLVSAVCRGTLAVQPSRGGLDSLRVRGNQYPTSNPASIQPAPNEQTKRYPSSTQAVNNQYSASTQPVSGLRRGLFSAPPSKAALVTLGYEEVALDDFWQTFLQELDNLPNMEMGQLEVGERVGMRPVLPRASGNSNGEHRCFCSAFAALPGCRRYTFGQWAVGCLGVAWSRVKFSDEYLGTQ